MKKIITSEEILSLARKNNEKLSSKKNKQLNSEENPEAEMLFRMSKWGKDTNNLNPWQRKFIFNMGIQVKRNYKLSDKQQNALKLVSDLAISKGFEK
jgi:hypothetical protein